MVGLWLLHAHISVGAPESPPIWMEVGLEGAHISGGRPAVGGAEEGTEEGRDGRRGRTDGGRRRAGGGRRARYAR